jgi:hypothetical protein
MKDAPFTEEFDIICDLNKGNEFVKNIRFKITVDLVNPGKIDCVIIGDYSHFEKISRLYFTPTSEKDFIKVISTNNSLRDIKFDLTGIDSMPIYQSFNNAVSTYDQIPVEIDNFCIEWKNIAKTVQRISFYFAGPQDFWDHLNNYQIDKKTKNINYINPSFFVPNFDGKIKIEHKPIKDFTMIRGNSTEHKTSKNALIFIPNKDLSISALKKVVFPVLEIFEKQFSLLQRKRVQWYKYQINTKDHSQFFIKNLIHEDYDKIHVSKFLIDYSKSLEFVKATHKNFYEFGENDFDLISPVNYYLSSLDISYIDASYAMLFFALEKLIDESVTKHNSYQKNYFKENKDFNDFSDKLKKTIKTVVSDEELQSLIIEKLRELNRPSFRRKLEAVLAYYNVKWDDIYENGNEFKFINIRNLLFHSNQDLNFSIVYNELIRLRSIFERIVLKLISWDDYSNCPPVHLLNRVNSIEQ